MKKVSQILGVLVVSLVLAGCAGKFTAGPLGTIEPRVCMNSSVGFLKFLECSNPLISLSVEVASEEESAEE